MSRIHRYTFILLIVLAQAGLAQTAATASVTGRVISEDGRALRAIVSLEFSTGRGFPSPTRRTFTGLDGSFSFTKLPPSTYLICAQVPDSEALQPAITPFLDTCSWGSAHPPITLAAGNQVTGLALTAPKGTWLKIRVADPDKVLPQVATAGPAPLDRAVQIIVRGADLKNHRPRFISSDGGGRNYQMVVPIGPALQLSLTSTAGSFYDQTGAALKPTDPIPIQAAVGNVLSTMTFTLHRAK